MIIDTIKKFIIDTANIVAVDLMLGGARLATTVAKKGILMKYAFLFCLFISFSVYADEQLCTDVQINELVQIENNFSKCKIDMSDASSSADMNNATYEASDCLISVAHQIFAKYYIKNQTQVEQDFDRFVKEIYNNSHNLIQKSDIAEKYNTGTMYNTMAIEYAHSQIKNLVKEYIQQIKTECADTSY